MSLSILAMSVAFRTTAAVVGLLGLGVAFGQPLDPTTMQLLEQRSPLQAKLVVWRRGTHEHPELSNQEQQTAAMMAQSSAGTPTALTTA
jgi:hypothetical protein